MAYGQNQLASRLSYRGLRKQVSQQPLTDEQIISVAPSIFAEDKHESRSARYTYIPTHQVLVGLRKEGFHPFHVAQSGTRVEGKEGFTKHFIRLRHETQIEKARYLDRRTDACNEIIIVNSHDGSCGYQMLAGCFRFVCQNGLICGDVVEDLRIRHSGNVIEAVVEGAYTILNQFGRVDACRESFQTLQLTDGEQRAFAIAAAEFRFADAVEQNQPLPVTPDQIIEARRVEDVGNDLWRTFNRAQENLVDGGLRKQVNPRRREFTRGVKSIEGNVTLNRALWRLAEEMQKLKTGAAVTA